MKQLFRLVVVRPRVKKDKTMSGWKPFVWTTNWADMKDYTIEEINQLKEFVETDINNKYSYGGYTWYIEYKNGKADLNNPYHYTIKQCLEKLAERKLYREE